MPLSRLPQGAGGVERRDIARGQATLGPDEFLNNIPGVYVQNRYNFSQGQRIEIRGAGARANFGIRGIKVLLDGIPQTLPDGQSQVTNVEWGLLERAEVLRGAASAIYGNATGGVVAYQLARDERRAEAALPSIAIVLVGLIPVVLLSRAMRNGPSS